MTTRVTIAVPVHNGAAFLAETLHSLLNQTWRDFRLICLDDASEDGSPEVARRFGDPRLTVLHSAVRLGLAANWNRAIEETDSDYLLIAHQDDLYAPEYLSTMVSLLETHPHAFGAHCRAAAIDEAGHAIADPAARYKETFWSATEPQEREPADELMKLHMGNYVIAPSVLLRRSAVDRLGPFDTSYSFVTDWEYWMRASLAGYTFVGTHERLVSFRRHARTATRAQELTMRRYDEELDLLGRFIGKTSNTRPYLAIENTLLNDFVDRLASGDVPGARSLARFAHDRIPQFAGSLRDYLMRGAAAVGPAGGRLLRLARRLSLEMLRRTKGDQP